MWHANYNQLNIQKASTELKMLNENENLLIVVLFLFVFYILRFRTHL